MKVNHYLLSELYCVAIGCLLILSVGCEDVDDEDELIVDEEDELIGDPSLVGTWMGGDIFIVTGWPEAPDTVNHLIMIGGSMRAEFSTDGTFELGTEHFFEPDTIVWGTGTWTTLENWLFLTYSDHVDTLGYMIDNAHLGLAYHYPVGDEHHQFEHWKIDHYIKSGGII